jgi:hypothetical protein
MNKNEQKCYFFGDRRNVVGVERREWGGGGGERNGRLLFQLSVCPGVELHKLEK